MEERGKGEGEGQLDRMMGTRSARIVRAGVRALEYPRSV